MPSKSSTPILGGRSPDSGSRCSKATATWRCRATPRSAGRAFVAVRCESDAAGAASSIGTPPAACARVGSGASAQTAAVARRIAASDQPLGEGVCEVYTIELQWGQSGGCPRSKIHQRYAAGREKRVHRAPFSGAARRTSLSEGIVRRSRCRRTDVP